MPTGMALAVPVALRRGHVMVFIPSLLNLGEFLITGNGWFVLVRVRLARKLFAGIADIEAEFSDAITGLRLVPRSGPVSCELWLYSRYGTLRHFRVGDAGLVEIDCYGTPLDQVKPAVTGFPSGGDEAQGAHGPAATGPANPGTTDTRGPILRWLARWNAARIAGQAGEATGSSQLKKILDTGGPGTKSKKAAGKKAAGKDPAAAGPAVPEKNSGPKKPVAGTSRHPGNKPVGRRSGADVPEENPDNVKPAREENPASQAGTMSALKEQPQDSILGSTESYRADGVPEKRDDLR
jgi:hypothetical protein